MVAEGKFVIQQSIQNVRVTWTSSDSIYEGFDEYNNFIEERGGIFKGYCVSSVWVNGRVQW